MTDAQRIRRKLAKLAEVDTSKLDDNETQRHRLDEARLATLLQASTPMPEAEPRKMQNGAINAGSMEDLRRLFGR